MRIHCALVTLCCSVLSLFARAEPTAERHLIYVAVPGIRADVQYGGTGILVFDADHEHRFVRRIPVPALGDMKHANPAKGICASAVTGRVYVSTTKDLTLTRIFPTFIGRIGSPGTH